MCKNNCDSIRYLYQGLKEKRSIFNIVKQVSTACEKIIWLQCMTCKQFYVDRNVQQMQWVITIPSKKEVTDFLIKKLIGEA